MAIRAVEICSKIIILAWGFAIRITLLLRIFNFFCFNVLFALCTGQQRKDNTHTKEEECLCASSRQCIERLFEAKVIKNIECSKLTIIAKNLKKSTAFYWFHIYLNVDDLNKTKNSIHRSSIV